MQLVPAAIPAQHPVRAARVRVPRVARRQQAVEVAVDRGQRHADDRLRDAEFLLQTHHAVGRRGGDDRPAERRRRGVVGPRVLARRDRREGAQRHAGGEAPRHLRGAKNRGVLRAVHKIPAGVACRTGADAARVEIARPVAAQQLAALREKRALLVEEHLECRQIDDRWIGLDLAEVGIHRAIECDVGTEAHFEIGAHAAAEIRAAIEGIGCRHIALQAAIGGGIGHQLEAARRLDPLNTNQLAHERRPTRAVPGDCNPEHILARRRIPVINIEAPHLDGLVRKAQLRKRDPHFRRPAEAVDGGFCLPHGIEPSIDDVLVVGRVIPVEPYTGRGDAEGVRGTSIVVAVERHPEVLGLVGVIAA